MGPGYDHNYVPDLYIEATPLTVLIAFQLESPEISFLARAALHCL
jgi:hypothetical protein